MTFKVKYMLFGKIAILLCLCLLLNNTFMMKSYAEDAVSFSPLFIPIAEVVTATAIASGIIANGSKEAIEGANQLVQNVISNLKTREIEKSEADANYVSPFSVIKGGKPEKPSNDNKNDKWVALGAGALAANEIWTNKQAIQNIMTEISNLKGYNKTNSLPGIVNVSDTDLLTTGSASGIALQLANISNSAVKQFDDFIHSDWWNDKNFTYNDCVFNVTLKLGDIYKLDPVYPYMIILVFAVGDKVKYLRLPNKNTFKYHTWNNQYGTLSYYYVTDSDYPYIPTFLDENSVSVSIPYAEIDVRSRKSNESFNYSANNISNTTHMWLYTKDDGYPYIGYKWVTENPWQFTNNVYNVNQSFDVNFPDWLQQSINLLGQQLDGIRLGLTSIQPTWNPTQAQIQSGLSPTNVINQYINNYENPEYIPEDKPNPEPNPDPDPEPSPEPVPEPVPDNEYLGNFLLPESITTKFPFCIPFDVARCLRLFSTSDREAPRWECDIGYGSSKYHVVIDLSMFNDVASFIRPLEYIVFLVGLAIGTRSLIRG